MPDVEKPAMRGHDGLSGVVQNLAAERHQNSLQSAGAQCPVRAALLRQRSGPYARNDATAETAAQARDAIRPRAPRLREVVLEEIERAPGTPEQIKDRLAERGALHLLTAIRPRTSELARMGLIKDSGRRDLGESRRCRSIVWTATTAEERAQWLARTADAEAAQ